MSFRSCVRSISQPSDGAMPLDVPMSLKRLFAIVILSVCDAVVPAEEPSIAWMFNPRCEYRNRFQRTVTSFVPSHVQAAQVSVEDLITIAMPTCDATHECSITLPSSSTRRAFFNSNRFLIDHVPFHDSCLWT